MGPPQWANYSLEFYYPGLGLGRGRKCTTSQKGHTKAFGGSTVIVIFVSTVSVKKKKR